MIFNMKIKSLYIILSVFLITSCTSENEALLDDGRGEVCFVLEQDENVGIETRATYDVNNFNVNLKNGTDVIFSDRKFSDIAGTTISCSAKDGYVFTAESCTKTEAESLNSKWGTARFAGEKVFEVLENQTNQIEVTCRQVNSSLQVRFSDFIKKICPEYYITFYAADDSERQFIVDQDNYTYKTAYFNVDESRAVNYTVTLLYAGEKHEFPGNTTINPSGKYTFDVKLNDESFSVISIGITVNGELDNEVTLDAININPYK